MQIDDWTDLIKLVLAESAFKTVGVLAMRALYQREVVVTDGTGDGGVDAWIQISEGPMGRIPVQFHSGRTVDWDVKLRQDVHKPGVKAALSHRLFFVCAQTPTQDAVLRLTAALEVSDGILVNVIDARALASLALSDPTVLASLRTYLPTPLPDEASRLPSGAEGAQLAFLFFHEASGDFREEVARSVLAMSLVRAPEPVDQEELLDKALAVLGGEKHPRRLFRRQLAALVAGGQAILKEGRVRPSADLVLRVQGEGDAGALAAEQLRTDCVTALEGRVQDAGRRRAAVDAVFDDLGFLLRKSVAERLPGGQREALVRLNAVERRLGEMLKPTGGTTHDALHAILEVARGSVYGRALASAELFLQMTRREIGELAHALTGRDHIEVVLDTSVAMPMLCAKLDRVAHGWVTSEVAFELHELLRARGVKMVVPNVYREEMAAHLMAARRYTTLAGEPDLARSENFFVAHYHAVAADRREPATAAGFEELLRDLGLPTDFRQEDFLAVRHTVERTLAQHLQRYGIAIGWVTFTEGVCLPLKQEPARSETVIDHDRRVVAWLKQRMRSPEAAAGERSPSAGLVLCSQDRWLLSAASEAEWLAVDPAALVDLMPMIRPTGTVAPLIALRELAAQMDDASAQRSAHVWDLLAEIEGPRLADRELLRRARAFKDEWLARELAAERPVAAEWARFKEGLRLDG